MLAALAKWLQQRLVVPDLHDQWQDSTQDSGLLKRAGMGLADCLLTCFDRAG